MCLGVLRASCFLWDRGDEEAPQGGRAEHLSQDQSPSIRSRAGQETAGTVPDLGIRHLHGDRDGLRPVWDSSLQVRVRTQIREEDQSVPAWVGHARWWGSSKLLLMFDSQEAM